jgi:2-polyprenyl-3-methyl-5-hydroxy-6-metoxy-1,4-benzoquinol methylase
VRYDLGAMSTTTAFASTQATSSDYHQKARREMLDFVPREARRILDVGCSEGLFGALLKERGAVVWGVEPVAEVARRAETRLDKVLATGIEAALSELPAGGFDCVVFNDVLEHLVDPYAVLRAAARLLSPAGTIVCSIPNVRYFTNLWNLVAHKQWRYEDFGVLDRTHLRFFTERSIVDMFRELDFELVRMQGINGLTSWKFVALTKLSFGLLSDVFHFQFACVARPRALR